MGNIPTITKNLLIINVLAFAATLVLQGSMGIDLNNIFGLHFFRASDFRVYQLVTYMFMHGGFAHLFFNMFALWMFGVVVEGVWGPRKFLFYYIACGIGAGLMQEMAQFVEIYLQLNSQSPLGIGEAFVVMGQLAQQLNGLTTVGASGAIYAILLASGMIFPENKIFIFPIPIPIKAKWFVMGYAALELFQAMTGSGGNVAHLAHLGGMIFGFFMIRYWQRHPSHDFSQRRGPNAFEKMKNFYERHSTNEPEQPQQKQQTRTESDWDYNARRKAEQDEVDRILDKIRKSGYDSLSREEKQRLFDQSKRQ